MAEISESRHELIELFLLELPSPVQYICMLSGVVGALSFSLGQKYLFNELFFLESMLAILIASRIEKEKISC